MSFKSLSEMLQTTKEMGKEIWEIVLSNEAAEQAVPQVTIFENMRAMYTAMKNAHDHYDSRAKSLSKMAGGDGEKLKEYRLSGRNICGDFLAEVMETAVKMGESNACMKRIVAAPTAGSCGVLPAVFITYERQRGVCEDTIVKALLISGAIGQVLATNAGISGAEGGCQAEIGSASAMAAGGAVYLEGGTTSQMITASTLAFKNMLGLACDPVAGLVEVPCIKRNVSGAVNAIICAQMALAGIESAIPADEVIDSMRRIGRQMSACLKETSEGGLAVTPTAQQIAKRMADMARETAEN